VDIAEGSESCAAPRSADASSRFGDNLRKPGPARLLYSTTMQKRGRGPMISVRNPNSRPCLTKTPALSAIPVTMPGKRDRQHDHQIQ